MKHLIDKDTVLTEIERLDDFYHLSKSTGGQAFIESLRSFLGTLEVKEVDLKKETQQHIDDCLDIRLQKMLSIQPVNSLNLVLKHRKKNKL